MTGFTIRDEQPGDEPAIAALTKAAFRRAQHTSGHEASTLERLRADGDLALSLVAENADCAIIGHCAFSPVTIEDGTVGWYGLGPVSVIPLRQRAGIGSSVVREGLARLRARGARGCVVLGNPEYYERLGFAHHPLLTLPGATVGCFMQLAFAGPIPRGEVRYPPAFPSV